MICWVISSLFLMGLICWYNRDMMKRTQETQDQYDQAKQNGKSIVEIGADGETFFNLARAQSLREYTHWVIITNDFPYDFVFDTHDLLVPKRPFNYMREANQQEREEYYMIKKELDVQGKYQSIVENFTESRSAPGHFHAHLVVWKK